MTIGRWIIGLSIGLSAGSSQASKPTLVVGSKTFTESYILAEIIAQVIEETGEAEVQRKLGLGGTGVIFQALANGDIDIYAEYSGTISEAILKDPKLRDLPSIGKRLASRGFLISDPLGFNNTYAFAVREAFAAQNGLVKIGDLSKVPAARAGFSHEFMKRSDGYPAVSAFYGLRLTNVQSMEHSLTYEALEKNSIDLTDVYSTDAKIEKFHLRVLEDNLSFFPPYEAVLLTHGDFPKKYPRTWGALLSRLEGAISPPQMIKLNALAELDKKTFAAVASIFLKKFSPSDDGGYWKRLEKNTRRHVWLVALALFASLSVGIPLGMLSSASKAVGQVILALSGIVQTIPSLALLCFLIPLFGIGTPPALVALFLYGLLPIVVNTHAGLASIDPRLRESAKALGLSRWRRMHLIELPLASRSILSGIKTSAIISIGTATLAALIGAGGYGAPIVTGLALNDLPTILEGAVPAAALALFVHGVFEVFERILIPRGIRF